MLRDPQYEGLKNLFPWLRIHVLKIFTFFKPFLVFFVAGLIFGAQYFYPANPVFAETATNSGELVLPSNQPIITESKFKDKFITDTEVIHKKTVYEDDPNTEAGNDTVLEEGKDGKTVTTTKVTFYNNEEYSREIISTDTTPAIDKKISRGTKIVWKTLDTPDGPIQYWKKMHVYATHYDSHCLGCNDWTAIGMHQGKGVIATDPKVIPMRTKLYIPEYGPAIAGDTGGAIKGNIIDLGFVDARTAGWHAHYIDIYLQ